MDTKKLTLIITLLLILGVPCAWAGQTTISGPTSCVMPELFGFNTPAAPKAEFVKIHEVQAPTPSGASGNYEVKKEDKLVQTEQAKTEKNDTGKEYKVTVYTICAK